MRKHSQTPNPPIRPSWYEESTSYLKGKNPAMNVVQRKESESPTAEGLAAPLPGFNHDLGTHSEKNLNKALNVIASSPEIKSLLMYFAEGNTHLKYTDKQVVKAIDPLSYGGTFIAYAKEGGTGEMVGSASLVGKKPEDYASSTLELMQENRTSVPIEITIYISPTKLKTVGGIAFTLMHELTLHVANYVERIKKFRTDKEYSALQFVTDNYDASEMHEHVSGILENKESLYKQSLSIGDSGLKGKSKSEWSDLMEVDKKRAKLEQNDLQIIEKLKEDK